MARDRLVIALSHVVLAAIAITSVACSAALTVHATPRRAPAVAYTADVVASFPHSAEAFTQGLELHEGRLYESTGLLGHSSLRVTDLESGRIDQFHALAPELFAEGLTVLGVPVFTMMGPPSG